MNYTIKLLKKINLLKGRKIMSSKIKGNGTIRPIKGKSDTWEIAFSMGLNTETGRYEKRSIRFKGSKREAFRRKEEFRQELEAQLESSNSGITFGDFSKNWLKRRVAAGQLENSTLERDKYSLAKLNEYLADMPIKLITPDVVKDLYVSMNEDGIGQNTRHKAAMKLNQILDEAGDEGLMDRNPCGKAKGVKPKAPDYRSSREAFSDTETAALMAALDAAMGDTASRTRCPEDVAIFQHSRVMAIKIALATGMRRGEVLGRTWNNVVLDSGRAKILVRQSLGKDRTLKTPKTKSSIRDIYLDEKTAAKLWAWKDAQDAYLDKKGIEHDDNSPVFGNENGGFIDGDNFGRWWRKILKGCGLDGKKIHELSYPNLY
jgi:integrase